MEVSAAAVKNLREKTGAGMMDCKKALSETSGDIDQAVDLLRKKGVATAAKKGKFELSDGATIFLDEVGDMSPKVQAKVLRVLEEQRFEPVGSGNSITVDVRVIAATNKHLEAEIEKGNFREDLYFRINTVALRVETLGRRDRRLPAREVHAREV